MKLVGCFKLHKSSGKGYIKVKFMIRLMIKIGDKNPQCQDIHHTYYIYNTSTSLCTVFQYMTFANSAKPTK